MAECKDLTVTLPNDLAETTNTDDKINNVNRELEGTIDAERRRELALQNMEELLRRLESSIDPGRVTKGSLIQQEVPAAADKKIQILSQQFKDAYHVYEWLKTNKDQFEGKIYGPIMLEINCSEKIAKYVEFSIPLHDLVAFVCEHKQDMKKLLQLLGDKKSWCITIVMAPPHCTLPTRNMYQPPHALTDISRYGFWGYLLDQVEGPDAVLNYLCHMYGLHLIPIGNESTGQLLDQIPPSISNFFSDTHNYTIKTSKFSGEKLLSIANVKQSVLLAGSLNTK